MQGALWFCYVTILVGCLTPVYSATIIISTFISCQIRGSKDLWNTYTRGYCLSMTGITLNTQALFVQKHNLAFLLVDQLVAVEEMFVLNPFVSLSLVSYECEFLSNCSFHQCRGWTQQMHGLVL